jgi:hypothetical protein
VQRAESKAVDGVRAILSLASMDPLPRKSPSPSAVGASAFHTLAYPRAVRPTFPQPPPLNEPCKLCLRLSGPLMGPAVSRSAPSGMPSMPAQRSCGSRSTARSAQQPRHHRHAFCPYGQKATQIWAGALQDFFDTSAVEGRTAQAQFLSCACRSASAWL